MPAMPTHECHAFPTDDAEFAAFAGRCLERLGEHADPGRLTQLVRDRYPQAIVRVQQPLARVANVVVWYVFRDG